MWLPLMCVVGMPAGGGAIDRRMCTVVYYKNPEGPEEEAATRKRASNSAKEPNNSGLPFETHRDIMSYWVANHEGSEKTSALD